MDPLIKDIAVSLRAIYPVDEALTIAKRLLCHICDVSPTRLLMEGLPPLTCDHHRRIEEAQKRLLNHEPLQYVLEEEWFCGLPFRVGRGVLIPRPETEFLVDIILRNHSFSRGSLLDVGTGSGCIAVALAKKGMWDKVYGWDISEEALSIARENVERHDVQLQLDQVDILSVNPSDFVESFDVIVSNPPYISPNEAALMRPNVLNYEPHTALFVPEEDPLLFYRVISKFAYIALKDKGSLYFEINSRFGYETCQIIEQNGFEGVHLFCDMEGNERMIQATKKNEWTEI